MSRGTITYIFGCMFSGKTTELLRRVRQLPPDAVRCFRHARDRRYDPSAVVSHTGEHYPAAQVATAADLPAQVADAVEMVAIEEAHFFDEALPGVVRGLADRGLAVVLTSLDYNCWGLLIPMCAALQAVADEHVHRRAVCARCGEPAERTQRLTPIVNGNLIGGLEAFEARCVNCWHPPPEPPQPQAWRNGDETSSCLRKT